MDISVKGCGFLSNMWLLFRLSPWQNSQLPSIPAQDPTETPAAAESFLNDSLNNRPLMEALWVASPSVADALTSGERTAKLALTVSRYVRRMTSRATPFGLFAGVTQAAVSDSAMIDIGHDHRRRVRVDAAWAARASEAISLAPDSAVTVWTDPTSVIRGSRRELTRDGHTASIANHPVTASVLTMAASPVTVAEVVSAVCHQFAALSPQRATDLVSQLASAGYLLSDVVAGPDVADPLPRLMSLIPSVDVDVSLMREAQDAAVGSRPWHDLAAAGVDCQVDLSIDADVTIPESVVSDVAQAVEVLWRTSMPRSGMTELVAFRDAFIERYGQRVTVPILEVIDPVSGIGIPTAHDHDETPDSTVLGRLMQEALISGSREIVLTDAIVAKLDDDPTSPLWRSLDVTFSIAAASTAAIDGGDYRVVLSPDCVSRRAGQVAGRFVDILDCHDTLRDIFAADAEAGGPRPTQVVYRPTETRIGNVSRVPVLLADAVTINEPDSNAEPVSNIGVRVDTGGLTLVSLTDGHDIEPAQLHMANPARFAPAVARLIQDIELLNTRAVSSWNWRGLETFTHLPRIRYGHVVMCPARWRVDVAGLDDALTGAEVERRVAAWRARWRVPEHVVMHSKTRRVGLDLAKAWDRRLLCSEVARTRDVVVLEDLADHRWTGGRPHELTAMLFASPGNRRPVRNASSRVEPRSEPHPPGGEWLYVSAFVDQLGYTRFITEALPELVRRLGDIEWYFVRYPTPQPHVRVRVHGDARLLNEVIAPAVHDWARWARRVKLVKDIAFATHIDETHRYGTSALPAAITVFHYDSLVVAAQIRARHARELRLSPLVTTVSNYVDILDGIGWDGWREWILDAVPASARHGVSRDDRAAVNLVVNADTLRCDSLLGITGVGEAMRGRRDALKRYAVALADDGDAPHVGVVAADLLHMHFNRCEGASRDMEERSLSLLREFAHALQFRRVS